MPNISYGIQTYYRTNTLLHTDLNSLNQFWIKLALLSFDCISWKTETCQDNFFFSLSLSVLQKVCTSALSSLWAGIWNCLAVPNKTLEAIWQGSDAIPGRLKESFSTSSISTDAHRNVHTTFSTEGAVTEPVPQEGTRHLQDLKPGWFCHRLPCCEEVFGRCGVGSFGLCLTWWQSQEQTMGQGCEAVPQVTHPSSGAEQI